jgi:hypothetical protein
VFKNCGWVTGPILFTLILFLFDPEACFGVKLLGIFLELRTDEPNTDSTVKVPTPGPVGGRGVKG